MKKKLAMLLAGVMAVGTLLTGCGNADAGKESTQASKEQTESTAQAVKEESSKEEETAKGDPDKIIVTYLYMTATPTDLEKVQAAVNEITVPAINVEVEFNPLGVGDSFTNYSLWISSGETVDLMMLAFQDIKSYANSGQIEDLTELVTEEKTPNLYGFLNELPMGTYVGDSLYGLSPIMPVYSQQYGMIIREEWLDECNYEKKDIYSIEDITNIFAQIKEKHPEVYPFARTGADVTTGGSTFGSLYDHDFLGGNVLAGSLMDMESTTVENLFETEEYQNYLQTMSEWYEAGYIVPDAATTDISASEMLKSGKVACYAMSQQPNQFAVDYGFSITGLPMTHGGIGATSNPTNWVVPITSSNPDAALKFMDYLYTDHELSNLITWGIEGEHVKLEDANKGIIAFADGLDGTNSPYYNTLGLWGDRRYEYTMAGTPTAEDNKAFEEKFSNNHYKSYGFVFDSVSVSNQIMACQTVLDQYQKALETGSLGSNWKSTYDTMVSQLKTAGIDDIIKECQTQLDAYLASK